MLINSDSDITWLELKNLTKKEPNAVLILRFQ